MSDVAETALTIPDLRAERGWTLDDLCDAIGVRSRGYASRIERGARCSVAVALRIEELSGGRIPAASLNGDVALVDAARGGAVHDGSDTSDAPPSAPGNGGELSERERAA